MSSMEQSLRKRITELQREVQKLKDFYGPPENYESSERPIAIHGENSVRVTTRPPVLMDGGELARKAKV